MTDKQVASKYSRALFNLGKEQSKLDTFNSELELFRNLLAEHRELERLFNYYQLPPEKKKRALREILQGNLSEQVLNFLQLLIDKRREGEFVEISREFTRLYYQEKGISRVEVISAVELTRSQLEQIEERLQGILSTDIRISERVKPEIIGGLIIRIGDYLIDGSIHRELNSIRERIDEISVNELGVAEDAVKA